MGHIWQPSAEGLEKDRCEHINTLRNKTSFKPSVTKYASPANVNFFIHYTVIQVGKLFQCTSDVVSTRHLASLGMVPSETSDVQHMVYQLLWDLLRGTM